MLKSNCRCQINASDIIIRIEGVWDTFFNGDNGESQNVSQPIGRSIWDFIQGLSTRNIYHVLMNQVRQTGDAACFPFQVGYGRYMEMKIFPDREKSLWFQTSLIPPSERPAGLYKKHFNNNHNSLVSMCAWCNQISVGADWLPVENAIRALDMFNTPEAPPISHSMCPDCSFRLSTTLNSTALQKLPNST